VRHVAALADVHGNAPALEAVLAEVEAAAPDIVVFCGDLTWGSLPRETLALVRALRIPSRFVRGNGDRAVGTLLEGRGEWMAAMHPPEDTEFVGGFEDTVSVDVAGLGPTCFCHGSPRSDIECVTERTSAERVREFMVGVDERVVVTAHVHVQYDRVVDGVRLLSPGSVGLPYEGQRGAYWALLGPDVDLRRTEYDVDAAVARMRATDDPAVETIVGMMLEPPAREEAIEHAEEVVCSE
jgi:predicted phosphodiesterase